jgi:DNA-binding transcriptional MerR regulator
MDGMTIGQLAARTGLSISAIRFYQRRGLLPARQTNGGWQRFGPDSMARLTVIKLAKDCGFTLDEIAVLLDALYAPTSPTATWQAMGEAKLAEVDAQSARLQQMRRLLIEALSYCHLDLDRSQIIATALDWADRPSDQPSLAR